MRLIKDLAGRIGARLIKFSGTRNEIYDLRERVSFLEGELRERDRIIESLRGELTKRDKLIELMKPMISERGMIKGAIKVVNMLPFPAGIINEGNLIELVNHSFSENFGYPLSKIERTFYTSYVVGRSLQDVYWFFRRRPETEQVVKIRHNDGIESYWMSRKIEIDRGGKGAATVFCLYPRIPTNKEQLTLLGQNELDETIRKIQELARGMISS